MSSYLLASGTQWHLLYLIFEVPIKDAPPKKDDEILNRQ